MTQRKAQRILRTRKPNDFDIPKLQGFDCLHYSEVRMAIMPAWCAG